MGLGDLVVRQFARPEGAIGVLVGWIMATRPSNLLRNRWTVDLLRIGPRHRVLELGCGPGIAVAACAARATGGLVVGLDHSEVMLAQASRRNRNAIGQGRVNLHHGGVGILPALGAPFDRILLVNVVQFLPDKVAAYHALHAALAPGGVIATTYQPRHRNPTRDSALRVADETRAIKAACGFEAIRTEELSLHPVPAVCVLGRKVPAGAGALSDY